MSFYRVVPVGGAPCVRQAGTVAAAAARALREHPAGLQSVELLHPAELVKLVAEGWPLPAAARALAGAHAAAQKSKGREAARKAAARNAAREAAAVTKEKLLAQARAEKEKRRALLQAERRREKLRVQREARRAAEVSATASPMLASLPLPESMADDTSAPW